MDQRYLSVYLDWRHRDSREKLVKPLVISIEIRSNVFLIIHLTVTVLPYIQGEVSLNKIRNIFKRVPLCPPPLNWCVVVSVKISIIFLKKNWIKLNYKHSKKSFSLCRHLLHKNIGLYHKTFTAIVYSTHCSKLECFVTLGDIHAGIIYRRDWNLLE